MKSTPYFFQIALLFLIFSACKSPQKLAQEENVRFFVGTATNQASEGIYVYAFNQKTGEFKLEHKETGILNPSFLTLSKNNQYLYAIQKVEEQKESGVSAFAIDKATGKLQHLNQQSVKGRGACYISTDAENKNILVANYGSGSVALLPIQANGTLATVNDVVQHEGSSVNEERQKGPHAHYIHPGFGNMIYAADLGIDKVLLYQIENGKFKKGQPASLAAAPGSGPRHLDFHPNGRFLYMMNEMGGSVTVFEYNKVQKSFKNLQTISSLPKGFDGYNKSADIHVHPSGNFLYASNRGMHDSIAAFAIDAETGLLKLVEVEQESIVWPRNFAISPNGQYLLCANLNDDTISIFKIDNHTGALNFTDKKVTVPKPLCIKFGEGK